MSTHLPSSTFSRPTDDKFGTCHVYLFCESSFFMPTKINKCPMSVYARKVFRIYIYICSLALIPAIVQKLFAKHSDFREGEGSSPGTVTFNSYTWKVWSQPGQKGRGTHSWRTSSGKPFTLQSDIWCNRLKASWSVGAGKANSEACSRSDGVCASEFFSMGCSFEFFMSVRIEILCNSLE